MRKYIGIAVILILSTVVSFAQTDSLGIEKQGDKVFVVHKVKSKQTLFSLAKRYKTSVTAINNANPALARGLQVGQTLKIPFGGELPDPNKGQIKTVLEEQTHKVQAGETLFAIARKYEVSVTDLKSWNQLSSNSLALGQELKIQVEKEVNTQDVIPATPIVASTPVTSASEIVTDTTNAVLPIESITDSLEVEEPTTEEYDGTSFKSFNVEGVAEVIDEEEPSSKFFALHRTAKVGTVIKVKNLMNDLTVYVRVVGSIPGTTGNDNVIIKLNQRAYEHLKAIDKRFRVQLSYFQ